MSPQRDIASFRTIKGVVVLKDIIFKTAQGPVSHLAKRPKIRKSCLVTKKPLIFRTWLPGFNPREPSF
jgi:hypothetical protein